MTKVGTVAGSTLFVQIFVTNIPHLSQTSNPKLAEFLQHDQEDSTREELIQKYSFFLRLQSIGNRFSFLSYGTADE